MRGRNQCFQAAFSPGIHRHAVAKVGVRVEEGRAYPGAGAGIGILNPVDDPGPDLYCDVPYLEVMTDQRTSAENTIPGRHGRYLSPILNRDREKLTGMAKKGGGRLISSAGLVNYYESEDKRAVHINPVAVIVAAVAISVFILVMTLIY
jgi:preprotein translocase subunit Sec61beta